MGDALIVGFTGRPSAYCDETEDEKTERLVKRRQRLIDLQRRILEAAAGDTFELTFVEESNGKTHRLHVPRAPFEIWALGFHRSMTAGLKHLAPAWSPVSPFGTKMFNDDPYHTDWWVGAGLDPDDAYNYDSTEGLRQAIYEEVDRVERRYGLVGCTVLAPGPRALGPVWHAKAGGACPPGAIAVVRDARATWWDAIQGAAAVVCERGGEMSHLVDCAREQGLPIVRVGDALKRYPEGITIEVDPETRTVDAARVSCAEG